MQRKTCKKQKGGNNRKIISTIKGEVNLCSYQEPIYGVELFEKNQILMYNGKRYWF